MWKMRNKRSEKQLLLNDSDYTTLDVDSLVDTDGMPVSHYIRPQKNIITRLLVNNMHPIISIDAGGGSIVFPTGIFYRFIRNPNAFAVEVTFTIGTSFTKCVCVQAHSTVHDVQIMPAPDTNAPRGQRWCERFGVITRNLLEQGIVERRDSGDLVVWKTFRHSPQQLTPFGMWCDDPGNSQYTIITAPEYQALCDACLAHSIEAATISIRPLLKSSTVYEDSVVELDARFPFLYHRVTSVPLDSPV